MRSCVACRTPRAKQDLARVVRRPDGTVAVDPSGRQPGRGAYLCRDAACLSAAVRRGALARALGADVPDSIEETIAASLHAGAPYQTITQGGAHGQE